MAALNGELKSKVDESIKSKFNLPFEFLASDALTNSYYTYEKIESIANWLLSHTTVRPKAAIICGSGLGGIANIIEARSTIPYEEIPEFPRSTVEGHKGNLIFGEISNYPVVCMQGRFHPFEGYSLALCCLPIKVFKLLGCELLFVTNAAGAINRTYQVGDLMVIKDHFSMPLLSLQHPLIGPNDARFGPRFPPIDRIYSRAERKMLIECGREMGLPMREGVYSVVGGPSYETITDSRFLHKVGCDCVGMSTAHETMVAHYCGMKVVGMSIVTDKVVLEDSDDDEAAAKEGLGSSHDEVIKAASRRAKDCEALVTMFFKKFSDKQQQAQANAK